MGSFRYEAGPRAGVLKGGVLYSRDLVVLIHKRAGVRFRGALHYNQLKAKYFFLDDELTQPPKPYICRTMQRSTNAAVQPEANLT